MQKIKLLVMDVDGTLTDGKIYMSSQGEMFKAFSIKDGLAIHDLLPQSQIVPAIITGRKSVIVENRCRELGIVHCYQGCRNKKEALVKLAAQLGLRADERGVYQEIAYIGDDINDVPSMKLCGTSGCPANAADLVKEVSTFVSAENGGDGAAREFIEWIIKGKLAMARKKNE